MGAVGWCVIVVIVAGWMMEGRFVGRLHCHRNCGDAEVLTFAPLPVLFRFQGALDQLRLLLLARLGRRHQRPLTPAQHH